ncbi:MAG: formylglycine-generating enzyme family protein [Kiritimatiellae bacterium]|nr:formylglycine-generating enzyme family protein [Kiritimatiellia bacterium]
MGSPLAENGRTAFQTTYWTSATGTKVITGAVLEVPHYVTLTNDYYIGVYELTQDQLKAAMGDAYTTYTSGKLPVLGARSQNGLLVYNQFRGHGNNWYCVWPVQGHAVGLATKGIAMLRTLTGISILDLPTEAQWEFACRADTATAFYGNLESFATNESTVSNRLDRIAWYGGNSGGAVHEVGLKEPNGWGLYDMLGNVWEVCLDGCNNPEAEQSDGTDVVEPVGLVEGVKLQSGTYPTYHVRRGGAADATWPSVRCATRALITYDGNGAAYHYGYRLVAPVNLDETNTMWGVQ